MNGHIPSPRLPAKGTRFAVLTALVLVLLPLGSSMAQEVALDPYLTARECTSLLGVGDKLLAGTDSGGVLFMDRADPASMVRWVSGRELLGNQVLCMTWSGRFVWVATRNSGLTRVGNLDTTPTFRQYLANLGSIDVTCVAGTIIGDNEIVYYGMEGAGIGKITDGITGFLFTADEDNLISDDVVDLLFLGEDLFLATAVGVSRQRNALFTDQNTGLTNLVLNDLCLDADGHLLAGGDGGVYRWNEGSESWGLLGQIGVPVLELAVESDGTIWALGENASSNGVLYSLSGSTWVNEGVPYPKCRAVFADDEVWVGGRQIETGMASASGRASVSRALEAGGFESWRSDYSLVGSSFGVGYGVEGQAWIGFWDSDAISIHDPDGSWRHLYQVASEGNDWTGLLAFWSRAVCFGQDLDNNMWAGQFGAGLLRIDPETLATDLVQPANSGLRGAAVLNILPHPDGPMVFLHDLDGGMVNVLLDPAGWEESDNWVYLPQTDDGIGSEKKVWDAVLERRDVIWFAVEEFGLVRWDINGNQAGPDDELTWADDTDDEWSGPVIAFVDTNGFEVSDPKKVRGLALAAEGGIWAGGEGLVRFVFDPADESAEAVEVWKEKKDPFANGLIKGSVQDVVVDVNGDVWAATTAGLNRLRHRDGDVLIDQWIDLGNYLLFPLFRDLYSPNVISELPGGTYNQLAIDETGTRILASSDLGSVQLVVEKGYDVGPVDSSPVDNLYCYPNPWTPEADEGALKLGGFPAGDDGSEPAVVEIYNVEGQLVYRHRSVIADTAFWWGKNRPGEDVTTGLYVVKITWQGQTRARTLAVVR